MSLTKFDLQNGIVGVQLPNGGRAEYRIIETMDFVQNLYDIVYIDEHYWDKVSGPYLSFQEAVDDLTATIDKHEASKTR